MRFISNLLLIAVVSGTIFYTILARNGAELIKISTTFSKDYYVGESTGEALTYAVLGDSTAFGTGATQLEMTYPYRIASSLANRGFYVHVITLAKNGARIRGVAEEQAPQLLKLNPNLVTVTVGSNDATHGTSITDYRTSLSALMGTLNDLGDTKVLVATTPDLELLPSIPYPLTTYLHNRAIEQNKALREAKNEGLITIVDLYSNGKLDRAIDRSFYASDKFHPADSGYDRWAQVFIDTI